MSNSIWHKYDVNTPPEDTDHIVLITYDGFHTVRWSEDIDWEAFVKDKIKKWCYLDELLAQANKAERLQTKVDELEHIKNGWAKFAEQKDEQIQRLQKAVDYALQVLDDVIEIGGIDMEMIKIERMKKETTNDK